MGAGPDSNSPGHVPSPGGRVKGKQGHKQKRGNVRQLGAKVRYDWSWSRKGRGQEPQGVSRKEAGCADPGAPPPPAIPCA